MNLKEKIFTDWNEFYENTDLLIEDLDLNYYYEDMETGRFSLSKFSGGSKVAIWW